MNDQPNQEGKLSGPGTIEIAGFYRVFRTRSMAWPDMLFLPLADQFRAALAVVDALTKADPSKLESSILIAERYLSGCLLHDSNSLVSASGQTHDNFYRVDVKAGILQFRTMMYAGQGKRTSCFKIQVSGNIRDGKYSVESPADGPVILTFHDGALKQADFFSKILAPLCLVNLIQREQAAHPENSGALTDKIQLTLVAKLCGATVCILVQKDGAAAPWEVFELAKGRGIGVIPAEALQDVDQLLASLTTLIEQAGPQPPAALAKPAGGTPLRVAGNVIPARISASAKS